MSGVRSWCDAFARKSRCAARLALTVRAISLNARATARSSVGPSAGARAPSSPRPSAFAASPRRSSGRARVPARSHASASPVAITASPMSASRVQLLLTPASTSPTGAETRIAPTTRPSSTTGTVTRRSSSPRLSLKRRRKSIRPCERDAELGPLRCGIRRPGRRERGGVREHASPDVRDDDALACELRRLAHERVQPAERSPSARFCAPRALHEVGAPRAEDGGVSQNGGLEFECHATLDVQRERDLERDHDRGQEVGGGEDEARSEAHDASSSREAKRKPTPRTVWM